MNKKIILGLVLIVIMISSLVTIALVPNEVVYASIAPYVEIPEQGKEITKVKGQTTFDAKSLFTINSGSFTNSQLSIGYTVKLNESVVSDEDLVIDFIDGNYTLTILIVGNGISIGAPVMQNVTFVLKSIAPSFTNEELMQEVKSINIQKNQGFIDLRILYKVIGNSFNEDEWTISYDAKYPGRVVDIFGDFIKSISGVYTLIITIHSTSGAFPDVESVPMTVIVQKSRPEVVFEYETETGKTVINDEHTIYIYAGTQYVNLSEYFTIYGNAYVRNEYSYSLIVKKDNNEGGYDNCQVFDGMISPIEGTYNVTVKVNPKIQGAFTPVVSDTITFYIRKAVPKVNERASVYVNNYDNEDKEIVLSNILSVSNSAYSLNQYAVSYSFVKDGETVNAVDGKVKLDNGEWKAISTITSNDGEFEAQITEFTMVVDVPMSTLTIILIICIPAVIFGGVFTALLLILRKKKKNESFIK